MLKIRLLSIPITLACCLLPVLTVFGGEAPKGAPGNDFAALAEAPKGWSVAESPRIARGQELFTVINGGAELYLRLGFDQAVFASYRSPAGKSINLEIYQMKTPVLAREVYTQKTGAGGRKMAFGVAALFEDYYLNFYKGNYQVTVSGYGADKQTVADIFVIAGSIDVRLPEK